MADLTTHLRWGALITPILLSACGNQTEVTSDPTDGVVQTKQACVTSSRRHVILVIGDGMQLAHEVAASRYLYGKDNGMAWQKPVSKHGFVTTWDVSAYNKYANILGEAKWTPTSANPLVGYNPELGGTEPYPKQNPATGYDYFRQNGVWPATDSASAAPAMATGIKTDDGNLAWTSGDPANGRLTTIAETLRAEKGMAIGVVSTVPFSHATPAAFVSHNVSRNNYGAIAEEIILQTQPEVVIGGGHPATNPGNTYISATAYDALKTGSTYVLAERQAGVDGAVSLRDAANAAATSGKKLFGLYGGKGGNFEYPVPSDTPRAPSVARGSIENPTLADVVDSAFTVLSQDPEGFFLMVEQGDIDWANHANNFANMIGGMADLENAVNKIYELVNREGDDITWENTTVMVTSDHGNSYMRLNDAIKLKKGDLPAQVCSPGCTYPEGQVTYGTGGHTNELVTFALESGVEGVNRRFNQLTGAEYPDTKILDNTSIYHLLAQAAGWNRAPVIKRATQSLQNALPGGKVTLRVEASDADGDRLKYSWSASQGKLREKENTKTSSQIEWTAPSPMSPSTITVVITDEAGHELLQTFTVGAAAPWFTLSVLPDTQVYSEENPDPFRSQINWTLANAEAEKIAILLHEGDVVDNGLDLTQWSNAMQALSPLLAQSTLPFTIVRGNHDDPGLFVQNLGPQVYRKGLVAAAPNGLNTDVVLEAAGRHFLSLGINKDPSAEELAWASATLHQPELAGMPTIVTTHDYLVPGGRSTTGESIWQGVVRDNPQVFMVLNGHTHTEYRMVSHDAANKPVYQMLADYQDRTDGGQALLRLIKIDVAQGLIDVKTYSPGYTIPGSTPKVVAPFYETDESSQFTYSVNLAERFNPNSTFDFGPEPPLPPPPALVDPAASYSHIFQQRRGGYAGTVDTQINENNATLDYAGEATCTTDQDDNGSRVQSMLVFNDIIGSGAGQIPPGATITSAKLYFTVTSSTKGSISVHRMSMPWAEHNTWIDFTPVDPVTGQPTCVQETFYDPSSKTDVTHTVMLGGGVDRDDVQDMSKYDARFTCHKPIPVPHFVVDVTASVQAWANGQTNYGWLFQNDSTDGWDCETGDGGQPPALVVVVEGAPLIQ